MPSAHRQTIKHMMTGAAKNRRAGKPLARSATSSCRLFRPFSHTKLATKMPNGSSCSSRSGTFSNANTATVAALTPWDPSWRSSSDTVAI